MPSGDEVAFEDDAVLDVDDDQCDDVEVEAAFRAPVETVEPAPAVTIRAESAVRKTRIRRDQNGRLRSGDIEVLVALLRGASTSSGPSGDVVLPGGRSLRPATAVGPRSYGHHLGVRPASAFASTAAAHSQAGIRSSFAPVEERYHREVDAMKRQSLRAAQAAAESLYGTTSATEADDDGAVAATAVTAEHHRTGRPPTAPPSRPASHVAGIHSRPVTATTGRPATASGRSSRPYSAANTVKSTTRSTSSRPQSAAASTATLHRDPLTTVGTAQVISVKRYDEDRVIGRAPTESSVRRPPNFFTSFECRGIDNYLRQQKGERHAPYLNAAAGHQQSLTRQSASVRRIAADRSAAVAYIQNYVASLGPLSLY